MPREPRSSVFPRIALVSASSVLFMAADCNDNGPGIGTDLGIRVVNALPNSVKVRFSSNNFSQPSFTLQSNGQKVDEYPGEAGNVITFFAEDDAGVYTPEDHSCTATPEMQAPLNGTPQAYGQANVLPGSAPGQPLIIQCSSGWVTND